MTWDSAVDALLAHFVTRWQALHAGIPIDVPNGRTVSVDASTDAFVRLRVLPSFSQRIANGGQLRSQGGRVVVTTFTPRGEGDGDARGYDREIESIWETAHANGLDGSLHLGAPEPVPGMPDPDVSMYRTGVMVPFQFEHIP